MHASSEPKSLPNAKTNPLLEPLPIVDLSITPLKRFEFFIKTKPSLGHLYSSTLYFLLNVFDLFFKFIINLYFLLGFNITLNNCFPVHNSFGLYIVGGGISKKILS